MVRKLMAVLLCFAVLSAVPISASAAAYDTDIPGDVLPVLRGVLEKNYGLSSNYLVYRDASTSDYVVIIGQDMSLNDGIVTYSGCDKFLVDSTTALSYKTDLEGSIDLSDGSCVYSNMGYYPDLIERSDYYEIATLIVLLACVFAVVLRSIFSFCLRSRRR